MDNESRIGFLPTIPLEISRRENEEENRNSANLNRKLETIAHYFMVFFFLIIIGFYVFFITSIVLDKYSNSVNFHINYPYAKDYEINKYLLKKAECLTICNLKNEQFEILFSLNKNSKIQSYKPIIIESSNNSNLSCITTAKKKGNNIPEIINRFKFNKFSESKIKINQLSNIGSKIQDSDGYNDKITHSSISIFTHRYREIINLKKIMYNSLNINYGNSDTILILKKYNENSFTLALKNKISNKEEEISIDNLFSIFNNGNIIN